VNLVAPVEMRRSQSGPVPRVLPRRLPLSLRRQGARRAAQQRAAAHTRKPLSAEQKAREPLRRPSRVKRWAKAVGAIVGSAAAHAAIVAFAVLIGALKLGASDSGRQQVSIQVRERERPKPLPPPPPPPPAPELRDTAPRQKAAAPKPEPEPEIPKETPKAAPVRVVGISLEATVEGGEGVAFAVGDTRIGQTATEAAAPRKAAPKTSAPVAKVTTARATETGPNRVASRIPSAKAEYTLPKRRRPHNPPYPAELRAQGLEADVVVMVSLDETGKVTSVQIITPSPYPAFNEAALAAAKAEEFDPALRDGVPVPYTLSYKYRFRIED
jgi:periplasmic protein TonB